ncbi:uncharacterized protein LOC112186200 [Rosa chinensis]|uniref:uncharacterized protein LOC112186200 n=1 Tax=Rosa chinensis TaxID=74649 RepID=UPI000D09131E|nr:uncharacterized protein LOC112186200 [Rosa chinensis]
MKKIKKFDVKKIFEKHGILPSDQRVYQVQDFAQAIFDETKFWTGIECISNVNGKGQHLFQIYFCLTAQAKFKNCSNDRAFYKNCQWSSTVSSTVTFPLPPPSHMVSANEEERSNAAQKLLKGEDRDVKSKK